MNRTANPISQLSRALALLLLCGCSLIHAQVPRTLNFQGYLTSPSGAAINNATLSLTFQLYTVASGGTALYSETQNVTVSNGIFNARIGSATALTLAFNQPYFVGISVGGDPEMAPRQPLVAGPYAMRSVIAESLAPGANISAAQITDTIGTAQIADNAVTQAKLSPVAASVAGKMLGSDGANLRWQDVGGAEVVKWTAVVTSFGEALSSTVIPAGSVLQSVSATATFANYSAACKSVRLNVDTPEPGYLASWSYVNPATPSVSANNSVGSTVNITRDAQLRAFSLRCLDGTGPPSHSIPEPNLTATVVITLIWTHPPRVIN